MYVHPQLHEVNALDFHNKCWQKDFKDYTGCEPKTYRHNLLRYLEELDKLIDERVLKYGELQMKEREVQAINEIEKCLKETEIQQQEILSTDGTTLDASLVTKSATLEASLVTQGIALDDSLVAMHSTVDSRTSSEHQNECNSSRNECIRSGIENRSSDNESSSSGNDTDADIGPLYDIDTVFGTDHTLRILLPKEDNVQMGKQGFGFKNKEDVENPSLLNKAKELAPCLYNIDEMGQDLLSDHKIISEEELKCEAEKQKSYDEIFCYVKHAMVKFENKTVSKQNPPRGNVFINSSFEDNVKMIARNQLSEEFEPLVKDVNL
ncbi:hypothetical protein Tco_0409574 [Tanacetum coccineum]